MEQDKLKSALADLEQHARAVHGYLAGLDRDQPVPDPPEDRSGFGGIVFRGYCNIGLLNCKPVNAGGRGPHPVKVGHLIDSVDDLVTRIRQVGEAIEEP